jgi:hypothetical protein
VESSKSLSQSFRDNKENHRRTSNADIMATSTRKSAAAKKAAAKAARAAKLAKQAEDREREAKKSGHEASDVDFSDESDEEEADVSPRKDSQSVKKSIKIQKLSLEVAQLRQQVAVQKAQSLQPKKAKKSKDMTNEEKLWFRAISDANKQYNWHKVKFCNSDEKLQMLTGNIFDKWNLKEFQTLAGKELADAKAVWIAQNQDLVRQAMNNVRNYVQSQLRTFATDRYEAGKWVPTPDQVRLCALRDPMVQNDKVLEEVFTIYHQELLAKVLGKEHWDPYVRNYNTISEARKQNPDGTAGDFCVTPGTEALIVVFFENCDEKWKLIAEERKKSGKSDPKREDARYKTKYINADGGRATWGGWTKEGRKAVADMAKLIAQARKEAHVPEMEKACLLRVQEAEGIVVDAEGKPKKKNRKRKQPIVEEESDDEFDCI